jgi:C4-dicarboxylate transporter DctQ subunit
VVPIMLSVLLVRLVLQLLAYSRAVQQGGDRAVAVPLIEDPEAVAKNEANTALSMSKD